jgi:hypothetical protein
MKNPRKNEPSLSDMLLKLRFAEKKQGFLVFFRHEAAILAGHQTVGPLCTAGFRGEIPLGLPSSTAC